MPLSAVKSVKFRGRYKKQNWEKQSQGIIPAMLYTDWGRMRKQDKKNILEFILLYFVINLFHFITVVLRYLHLITSCFLKRKGKRRNLTKQWNLTWIRKILSSNLGKKDYNERNCKYFSDTTSDHSIHFSSSKHWGPSGDFRPFLKLTYWNNYLGISRVN